MSVSLIFLIAALVLFLLSAFGVPSRINLQSAGLACVVVAMLIGRGML